MIKLGFVSAILPELSFDELITFAGENGFQCVEVMCWPKGKAERRYAGVTHIDVNALTPAEAKNIGKKCSSAGVAISGLGYYPNPLAADAAEANIYAAHLRKVIAGAKTLGVGVVNTFVGRDHTKTIEDNWPRFLDTWKPLVKFAKDNGINIGIENCPMSFTRDEWPGGKNLATSPAVWRKMWEDIPSENFGLNFDPSHFIFQQMDYLKPLREFKSRIFHVHAKDVRLDRDRLDEVGTLAYPNQYHTPKLPGLGDVDWGKFFAVLLETGYDGAVAIEVEDRAYEGSLEMRKAAVKQSGRYLRQFLP